MAPWRCLLQGAGGLPTHDEQLAALGAVIRKARRDRELSQEALAARAGTSAGHLSVIEHGGKNVQFLTVARIADALGITLSELVRVYEERMRG